ncbi:MAG: hypothetical protein ACJA2M_000935 [Polaribacter sp.]|jgi:hypothetical protein
MFIKNLYSQNLFKQFLNNFLYDEMVIKEDNNFNFR